MGYFWSQNSISFRLTFCLPLGYNKNTMKKITLSNMTAGDLKKINNGAYNLYLKGKLKYGQTLKNFKREFALGLKMNIEVYNKKSL